MRKGFVHMVEVIVVVVMAFFSFFQFAYITTPDIDWQRTKLTLMGNDILYSADMIGVNWFNPVDVEDNMKKLIGSDNIVYGLRLHNAIKQSMTIGCLCDDAQRTSVEDALRPDPLIINNENIAFSVIAVGSLSELFNPAYDVVIIPEYIDLSSQENNMMRFLSYDRGIIELFDIANSGQIPGVQENIFGLSWDDSLLSDGAGEIVFHPSSSNPGPDTYTIYKYFHSFPNTTGDGYFSQGIRLNNFIGAGSGVSPIDGNQKRIILIERGTNSPCGIINTDISELKGRTAWIPMGIPSAEDERNILKATIAWASGNEEYIRKNVMKNPVVVSKYKIYNTDMFQIIRIDLILDYL